MAKKTKELTIEEKLENALVPDWEQPYKLPENWCWTKLTTGAAECLDKFRKPINSTERANRRGNVPYYGATGQVGFIDDYLTDEHLVLVGEDGAPFLDLVKNKAYIIDGKAWVNNHAHILKSFYGTTGNVFLMHYLNNFDYSNYVNGTTRLKLTQASMNIIPFPLPPLAEQKRIVDRIESLFSKLDEAKELAQNALDSFENRKSAILHRAFTGELTKKWREESGVELDSWEETTLQQVCTEKITDGTHQTPKYSDKANGVPFISSKDVTSGIIDWTKIKYITKELHEVLYKRIAPQVDDVLLAKNGTTGIAAIVEDDLVFDIYVTLALLRPNKEVIDPKYLYNIVNSPICKEQFNSHLTGIGVPNLHLRDIREVVIPLPEIKEQQEIVRILDSIFEKEKEAKELVSVINKIDLIKKSILSKAFRGELGTNDENEESSVRLLREMLEGK